MRILYICTHNRCRSILSEAITNHTSSTITAKSAGSQPVGQVHPLSIRYLSENNINTQDLHSKSWDELESFQPDVVITVCDSAANETCPIWFGNAIQIHWGLSDPSKLEGSEQEVKAAFQTCIDTISTRVKALESIASAQLNSDERKQALIKLSAA